MNTSPAARNPLTHWPEVNRLLERLLRDMRSVLGHRLIGLYLDGSLATGDFDRDSDIDFIAVTEDEVNGEVFAKLRDMHDRISRMDSPWAIQLEGSYISRAALIRYDPECAFHPNIERGPGERLKMTRHGEDWIIHRHILRERGIPLTGPAPNTLIDPVSPDDLRRASRNGLRNWFASLPADSPKFRNGGYPSYIVLTLCRILYTLEAGTVVSKADAAEWAKQALGRRWAKLIERAWKARHNPPRKASEEDVRATQEFICFVLERTG